jgi:hypothetical protein
MSMPMEVTTRWLVSTVVRSAEQLLYSLVDRCMFHAIRCSFVCAFIDWSPFQGTGRMSSPVVEYSWDNEFPHIRVNINYASLFSAISNSFKKQRPSGYLAVHTCDRGSWGLPIIMNHVPLFSTYIDLLPEWVMRDTFSPNNLYIHRSVKASIHEAKRLLAYQWPVQWLYYTSVTCRFFYVAGSALIAAHLTAISNWRKLPLMIALLVSMGASLWLCYAVVIRNPFLTVSASTNLVIHGLTLSKILRRGMRPEIRLPTRTNIEQSELGNSETSLTE